MKPTPQLVNAVVKGIQEKKGKGITIIDLSGIEGAIASYFVVCQAGSPTQVDAVADSVEETVRATEHEKPVHVVGRESLQWVAMDYTDVMAHIFLPSVRSFYDLENLWRDAEQTNVPDMD